MECCKTGSSAPANYQPRGHIQQIGPVDAYICGSASLSSRTLVLLPDGFGLVLHNFILADMFAQKGWDVVIPDYFEGDPIPLPYLRRNCILTEGETNMLKQFDIRAWASRHPHKRAENLLAEFLAELPRKLTSAKSQIFGAGYCFGGKHLLRLNSSTFVAGVAFHPSNVEISDITGVKAPLFIGCGEKDDMVSPTLAEDLNSALAAAGNKFKIRIYPGMPHGFAARPNHDDEEIKTQFNQAFEDAVCFLEDVKNNRYIWDANIKD